MHDREKSDRLVVPANPPNKPGEPGAEVGEGRGLPEGNTARQTRPGLRAGYGVSSELDRVRRTAGAGGLDARTQGRSPVR
jgi:RNA-directed DNA polymerase